MGGLYYMMGRISLSQVHYGFGDLCYTAVGERLKLACIILESRLFMCVVVYITVVSTGLGRDERWGGRLV